jgi:hypothetical protein
MPLNGIIRFAIYTVVGHKHEFAVRLLERREDFLKSCRGIMREMRMGVHSALKFRPAIVQGRFGLLRFYLFPSAGFFWE